MYIKNKIQQFRLLRRFSTPETSLRFLIPRKMGKLHSSIERLKWKDFYFNCRDCDFTAVEEVLDREEYSVIKFLAEEQPPKVIIDAGSHIGLFAFYAFSLFPLAEIHSIEAAPATVELLKANKSLCTDFNWQIYHFALSSSDSAVEFAEHGHSMSGKIAKKCTQPALNTAVVPGCSLATLLDYIKNL